jgi:hypothetical protein
MPQVSAAVFIEHQRKRKYPTRRGTILLPARRLAKLRSRQIKSGDRYRHSINAAPLKSQHRVRVSLIWESLMSHSFGPLVLAKNAMQSPSAQRGDGFHSEHHISQHNP